LPWSFQRIRPSPRPCVVFRNKLAFYGDELLAPHPSPKVGDHPPPPSAVGGSPLNTLTATLHIRRILET
jgi:hypothetical protein